MSDGIKVKNLEWWDGTAQFNGEIVEAAGYGVEYSAATPLGVEYLVAQCDDDANEGMWWFQLESCEPSSNVYDTPDEAKAAAQKDYERRIKEAMA